MHFAFSKDEVGTISLSSSDNKKLEKADKELQKSKDAMKEADKVYEEIASKQNEITAEESEKLNNKALSKQIEALKIQQSSNKMKFEVYASKADEFWKKYKGNAEDMAYAKSLESSARLNFQSSEEQYKEADKGFDKLIAYSSMTSASDLSNKAVDDIKKAFDIYSSTPLEGGQAPVNSFQPVEEKPAVPTDSISSTTEKPAIDDMSPDAAIVDSPPQSSSSNIYQAVEVNENMIDQFNKFMQDNYPQDYEKYIVDFSSIDFSDINGLRDAWNNYLYGNPEGLLAADRKDSVKTADSLAIAVQQDSINSALAANSLAEQTEKVTAASPKKKANTSKAGKNAKAKKWKIKRNAADYVQTDSTFASSYRSSNENKYARYEGVSGFSYRVQVVASRVPMNNDNLKLIYDGTEQPEEHYENEWYKYSIGPFSTFAEARQFKYDCGVKGAFVIAFLNGKKINPNQELVSIGKNSNSFSNFNTGGDLIYKVQVAACRNEMTSEELKEIFANAEQLESSFEDNWYKYLIDCGNDYSKACSVLKSLRLAGAFIAVYKDGTRISLK